MKRFYSAFQKNDGTWRVGCNDGTSSGKCYSFRAALDLAEALNRQVRAAYEASEEALREGYYFKIREY